MLGKRALVLDDDPLIVDVLCASLSPTVRWVDRATEPTRALELFREHKHPVVLLDLVMPVMSGFEVMRRVHALAPRTQVIIVTGHPSIDSAVEAVNEHAFGYLRKPFELAALHKVVVEAFRHYEQLGGADPLHDDPVAAHFDEMAVLYETVRVHSRALEQAPNDPALQAAYRDSFARLRRVQEFQAEVESHSFRGQLALRKGEGYAAIEVARGVLARDKNSA